MLIQFEYQTMKKELAIEAKNLKKFYKLGVFNSKSLIEDFNSFINKKEQSSIRKKQVNALDGIDFQIFKGEKVALLGRNGSGKSTFIKVISRITTPSSGEVKYRGKLVSVIEQGIGFNPELTAIENINLNASILGCSKKETDLIKPKIIEFSGIEKFIDTPIKRYSSGMVTRLGFSIAAFIQSDIFIVDEVLAVGDENFRNKCINLIQELAKNEEKTLIFVSHEMDLVKKLCDRAIVLSKGKVVFNGNIKEGIEYYQEKNKS